VRSIFEFALTIQAWGPNATRQSVQPIKDVGYGIITLIYLLFMYITASVVSSGFDRGGKPARLVESDVRLAVLRQLQQETDQGRRESPPFSIILDLVANDLDNILSREGALSANSSLAMSHKQQAAAACLQKLREKYGNLDPKEGKDYSSRNTSAFSTLLGRTPLGRLGNNSSVTSHMRKASNQSMGASSRRASNQSMRRVTPTQQQQQQQQQRAGQQEGPAAGSRTIPRPPSYMSSVNSTMPSRWAPSVSYPDAVPEVQEQPLNRNERQASFRDRMRHGR